MARNTILLRGEAREEGRLANGALTPGMLVELESGGDVAPHGVQGAMAAPIFVRANHENDGAGIDAAITNNTSCTILFPEMGAKINAVTEDTIAEGDFVTSDGSGGVELAGTGDYVIGVAAADSDLSGTVGRVEIYVAPLGAAS